MTSKVVEPTKMKKMVPEPPSVFPLLPDEIIENILARVSRWKYPSLSLVSKRFYSLLSSMEIYKTRSEIGANETCVYVCLKLSGHPCASWFSLRTKPNNQKRTKRRWKRSKTIRFKRDFVMSVVPIPSSSTVSFPGPCYTETVGSDIYIIGGPYKKPCYSVRIFDCRSHTWRNAPNMTVARENARTVLLDEKIYVMGGCDINKYNANWIEVFDIKSQSWTALPCPGSDEDELRNHLRENSEFYIVNALKGKIYLVVDEKDYTFEPKNGTWKLVREKPSFTADHVRGWCDMGNVIYCLTDSGYLMWSASEIEGREWREIKGLEKLRENFTGCFKSRCEFELVGCDGQLLVMWDPIKRRNKFTYAKISLESRCNGREICGATLSVLMSLPFLSNHIHMNGLVVLMRLFDDS